MRQYITTRAKTKKQEVLGAVVVVLCIGRTWCVVGGGGSAGERSLELTPPPTNSLSTDLSGTCVPLFYLCFLLCLRCGWQCWCPSDESLFTLTDHVPCLAGAWGVRLSLKCILTALNLADFSFPFFSLTCTMTLLSCPHFCNCFAF